ncbi:MAG: valine--tRNA ligase [Kiritimatiellae bacterium]|jgi:valyl-tRNA synthetase|nr:valine--tRNA ligase [Kiritimatiellia bacterium]
MEKNYDPKIVENKWYEWWEKNGHFHSEPKEGGKSYSVVIPPPNVTGILHMGHALNNTIQDVLVRWKRMQGYNVVWVPGTDHAGIATQNVVEKALAKEGKTRDELGREKFLERVWEWRAEYGDTIVRQLRKLGASCDWKRERFTMDEGLNKAVVEVFCRLYDEKLIYRGNYIVNWCPRCHTALSDEESEHQDETGKLWHIRYPVQGGGEVVVATTRPETMLGDTAVAVNPEDERYQDLIGKKVILPLMDRELAVVADDYVDREFGTGVVKMTPAHDPNDFQVAQRHNLEILNVMNGDATMNENAGKYVGMDRFECRKQVVADLEALGLLVKIEDHQHAVGHCYRCDAVVEPRLSNQWFVKMAPLAEPALEAVRSGKIKFNPKRWEKVYFSWLENIRDWCISRQIWWGHRIPVYTCADCGLEWAARETPLVCTKCESTSITQDEDVLDTWFSSWLWPFSTLGWPEKTEDLDFYYPTNDLATAPEIIFFWVARMIMAGCKFMDDIPFDNVYLHGTVRDDQGRKMSKSLGNSMDPLDVIEKYSADSLRFSMMQITSTGMDVYVNMEKFEIGRNFGTKIWNAARFMQMQMEKVEELDWHSLAAGELELEAALLRADDRHMLAACDKAVAEMTEHLERYRLQDGALVIYDFIWNQFCDWYLEYAKLDLFGDDEKRRVQVLSLMTNVFAKSLKLLHPYMPFLTEELWHEMGYGTADETIMKASWPVALSEQQSSEWGLTEDIVSFVAAKREMITAGRALRAEYNIAPSKFVKFVIEAVNQDVADQFSVDLESLKKQLRSEDVEISSGGGDKAMPGTLGKLGTIYLPLEGLVDVEGEKVRVTEEISKNRSFLKTVEAKLSNERFVANAPEAIVKQQQERRDELVATLERLEKLLASFEE